MILLANNVINRSQFERKGKKYLSVLESHKGIIYKVVNTYCNDKSDQNDLIQEIALQI